MHWWPRSIRRQLLAGQVLIMGTTLTLFIGLVLGELQREVRLHTQRRLAGQADLLATEAANDFVQQRPELAELTVKLLGKVPSVAVSKITYPAGSVRYASPGKLAEAALLPVELAQIALLKKDETRVFFLGGGRWEAVRAIYVAGKLQGYAWVEADPAWDEERLHGIQNSSILVGLIWITTSVALVFFITRSISRPLKILRNGARDLMRSPQKRGRFPLPVNVHNEIGDLIATFNQMVAANEEQRAGLNDTLSILDSMLANAPIGLAFFDRRCRIVRVNQFFAGMSGIPLSRHLGRSLPELLPAPVAQQLEDTILRVFSEGVPVRNVELNGPESKGPAGSGDSRPAWTWLASAYPVRTNPKEVRWVGAIILDASERKRSEEALRKTEKLAATGRLAASIAHEINNPLEAITNLLYLLRHFSKLKGQTLDYVVQAEHEARRIAEITQQTLRFYRQSTHPARANLAELLDSVLGLYQGRLNSISIHVERDYDPLINLFCFAGELRQVFANLIGNAIDASRSGGRLVIRARRSSNWKNAAQHGVRFTVADTGAGMEPEVKARIFEAFFTTKEATGTGLGLWVSHGIIVKHDGLIHVRSRTAQPGRSSGTVFQLFLPDNPALVHTAQPVVSERLEEEEISRAEALGAAD
jgi:PAS domain S-box-containing protein